MHVMVRILSATIESLLVSLWSCSEGTESLTHDSKGKEEEVQLWTMTICATDPRHRLTNFHGEWHSSNGYRSPEPSVQHLPTMTVVASAYSRFPRLRVR